MSKKVIGIKQADGSFFPILKDGEPASKTLEVTTVRDGQTTVKINLYKQYEDTEELEYVDTLLIENLVPHLKEEPSFKLSINLDEDNVLAAEVLDPETGAKSDTSVSLVTLSEAQQSDTSDFELAENPDIFDDIGTSSLDVGDDFNSLADFEENTIENSVIEEETDNLSDDTLGFDDADFNFDDIGDISDDFTIENNEADPLSMDNDFNTEEPASSSSPEEDPFSISSDDLSFSDSEATEDSFDLDGFTSDSLSLDGDDDFSFPENTELHDDLSPPSDDFLSSIGNESSSDSLDLGNDFNIDDDFGTSDDTQEMSMSLDDDFTTSEDTQEMSMSMDDGFGDDFGTESLDFDDNSFSSDSLDLGDKSISDSIDFNGDFDLDSTETTTPDFNDTLGDDFDVGFGTEEDAFSFNPTSDNDNIQYAEHGEQDKKFDDTSSSFIPPLYDEKFKEDIEKRRTRGKYSLSMVVCIICALICIAAVILAFVFGSWPGDNPSVVNNVVTVEPPQVFEQERQEAIADGIEKNPPTPEENTIEIVIEEEVIPVKPEPAPEARIDSIDYLLIWGDTLWDLSDTYYRNPWLYDTIADANDIEDPDYIIAGTYIEIPSR